MNRKRIKPMDWESRMERVLTMLEQEQLCEADVLWLAAKVGWNQKARFTALGEPAYKHRSKP